MQEIDTLLQQTDATLFAAIDRAVQEAAHSAGDELTAAGLRKAPYEYFADGALRYVFMRLCGADPTTNAGGNPKAAWEILYAGRNVARRWEREQGSSAGVRKRKDRVEDLEKDDNERRQFHLSARNFAVNTVLKTLVAHARASDPNLDERLTTAVEARFTSLAEPSEMDLEFTNEAKRILAALTAPLD
jgi:hypothetical protein